MLLFHQMIREPVTFGIFSFSSMKLRGKDAVRQFASTRLVAEH